MAKRLFIPLLIAIISLIIAVPVLAAYYVDIDVTESNGTDYDMLPVLVTMDIDYLAEHGFISETGLDVRVKNSQGSTVPFMLAEDRAIFASGITGDMVSRFQLTTDNDPLDSFAVCTGDGGYITIADHTNLELGNNFKCEFEGYIDTDTEQEFITKGDNFVVWTDGDGTISAELPYYVYREGYKASGIDWQQGYIKDVGSFSDQGTYLFASGTISSTGEGTGVTTVDIDLTDVSTIYIDWKTTYGASASGTCYFIASTEQMSSHSVYDAQKTVGEIDRQIDTLDVSGLTGEYYLRFHAFAASGTGAVSCTLYGVWFDTGERLTPKGAYVNTAISTGDYKVAVWTSDTNLGIDIEGDTKATDSISRVSYLDNSDNWILSNMPYLDYYTHTVSDSLLVTYEPDSIISGTTLPNEEDPGTYDGTITWGANPGGISVSKSGLSTEEAYYIEDIDSGARDIISPEPAELISGLDLERLEANPFYPLVEAIVEGSNGKFTTSLVWIGGAWFLFIAAIIGVFIGSKQNLVFTAAVGLGLSILLYVMGIFDYWVIIIFGLGTLAAVVHERMPTW